MARTNLILIDKNNAQFVCIACDEREFGSEESLLQHCRNAACHTEEWCDRCEWLFVSANAQAAHFKDAHLRCSECQNYFQSENELDMHQQTHLPRNHECYGCYRKFATDSAILIHLESGGCASQVSCDDIDKWAFQCYQHRQYTHVTDADEHYLYRCKSCERKFKYLSGLFQHIETPTCAEKFQGYVVKLKNHLISQVHSTLESN